MSVEDETLVDFIGIENSTGNVVLTISDHLEWDEEHFRLLEKKILAYIDFVKSGLLLEKAPDADGKDVLIRIVHKHKLTDLAKNVLRDAQEDIKKEGISLAIQALDELKGK